MLRALWALAAAGCVRTAAGVVCDFGDAVQAVYDGDGQFKGATIAAVDLTATPDVMVTVDWDDLSPDYRAVRLPHVKLGGAYCDTVAYTGQSFTAVAGEPFTLLVAGPNLTESVRVLIVGQAAACDTSLTNASSASNATLDQDPAVSIAPAEPLGVVDMQFFGVVVDTPATYTVCFWSGVSPFAFATKLGPLVVSATTTTTTTTTTSVVPYSRRRGTSHERASLKVQGSQGSLYEGLTANPAAWNVHAYAAGLQKTCRRCQMYRAVDVDGDGRPREANELVAARLIVEPPSVDANATAAAESVGFGCEATGQRPAPPAPAAVLMVARGACTFEAKARAALERGYRGLIVVDFLPDSVALADMAAEGGAEAEATLPAPPAWLVPAAEGADVHALASGDPALWVDVADLVRLPRLASGLSDAHGSRNYAVQ